MISECRYNGKCRIIGAFSPRECDGCGLITTLSAVGTTHEKCGCFAPMPDVGALLAIADEMDSYTRCADDERCGRMMPPLKIHEYARRIREACGATP